MATFKEFYEVFCNRHTGVVIPEATIREAFDAGQSARPNVITAHQLRERLVNMLAEYDAETAMVSEQSKTLEYGAHVSIMVCAGRNQLIKKHRDALGIINEFIEIMESEQRAAEVSR